MLIEASPEAAIMGVTLDDARRYCNALSDRAGWVPCYEVLREKNGKESVVPKAKHLDLNGYRLPTDGEWELACRAGTTTSRYFGNVADVVASYGWTRENNAAFAKSKSTIILSQRVAALLPNRWGLFDNYGNAKELCDTSLDPRPGLEVLEDAVVPIDSWEQIGLPTLRGVSVQELGTTYARSHSRTKQIVASNDRTVGLRVARTIANSVVAGKVVGP
jgi:formylglycine-generating enzyme required for sulfatase activity